MNNSFKNKILITLGSIIVVSIVSYALLRNNSSTSIDSQQLKYDNITNKLVLLNVGDYFPKYYALMYNSQFEHYGVWCDIKEQTPKSSFYEIKGGFNKNQINLIAIQWRYYIKTENDTIISITKR